MTEPDYLKAFLTHPAINLAYVAEKLYGENTNYTRGRLSNKIHGKQSRKFTPSELAKLEEIRSQLLTELAK